MSVPLCTMRKTDEYEKLVDFFIKQGLEFEADDAEVTNDIICCYEVVQNTTNLLVGGFVIALREGKYIIDGIAVDPLFRKHNIGKVMLDKAVSLVREMGGDAIYLVARAPGFFRKYGFDKVAKEDAPTFFECNTCPQNGVSCHPEIMRLVL